MTKTAESAFLIGHGEGVYLQTTGLFGHGGKNIAHDVHPHFERREIQQHGKHHAGNDDKPDELAAVFEQGSLKYGAFDFLRVRCKDYLPSPATACGGQRLHLQRCTHHVPHRQTHRPDYHPRTG